MGQEDLTMSTDLEVISGIRAPLPPSHWGTIPLSPSIAPGPEQALNTNLALSGGKGKKLRGERGWEVFPSSSL